LLLALSGCGEPEASARAADPPATRAAPAAHLASASGDVRWLHPPADWRPARAGLGLAAGDSVQTMAAATASIRFEDTGATLDLDPLSTMRIPNQRAAATRLRHVEGRLVARIERPASRDSRMEVELPPGTLVLETTAVGSTAIEARIDVTGERTEVAMIQGGARLDRARGGALAIAADHFVALRGDGEVIDEGAVGAAATLVEPAEGATLAAQSPIRFSWERVERADGYVLTITPVDSAIPAPQPIDAPTASAVVTLPPGTYTWRVRGLRQRVPLPRSMERRLIVELDRTPPALAVQSVTARAGRVTVTGQTEPGAQLTLDGRPARVGPDGSFVIVVGMPAGLANLVLRATDASGNTRSLPRTVVVQ
jgi:hypothetical protein